MSLFVGTGNLTPVPDQFPESISCFPRLWRLHTSGFRLINWLFTESGVKLPELREFAGDDVPGEEKSFQSFFTAHQSIKDLYIRVGDDGSYGNRLRWTPNLEKLTIRGAGHARSIIYANNRRGNGNSTLYLPQSTHDNHSDLGAL